MAVKIQIRNGLSTEWTSVNPVLMQGELGLELDTGKFKAGDGTKTWSLLAYSTGGVGPAGIQGPVGTTGATLYTWIKYADTPTTGMSDSPAGKKYFGIAYNKASATKSLVYTDYSWSLTEGIQGIQGLQGGNVVLDDVTPAVNKVYSSSKVNASLAAVTTRVNDIITTPVPVGEVIAQEIIDARQGEISLGANLGKIETQLADVAAQTLCTVGRSVELGLVTGVGTNIPFTRVILDTDNMYDVANNTKITIKKEGTYVFSYALEFATNGNGGARSAGVVANISGLDYYYAFSSTNAVVDRPTQLIGISVPVKMKIGDYVILNVYQNSGLNVLLTAINTNPNFSVNMTDRVTTGVPLIDNSNVINRSTPVAATNDITSGYTLTPLDLHFDCQKVISGRVGSRRETGEEFLLAFDDDFANDPNAVNANTLIKYNTLNSSDLSYDCTNGSMAFSSTFSGYAEAIYSTPIKLKGPVFHAVLDVLADSINFAPRVGLIKDADNWVQAVYSKLDLGTAGIEIKVGGIFTSYYGHMPAIAAPYKLHFQINNIIVSMLIEKDGKMYRLAEQNISSKVNFTDYATLKSYNLMFAVTTNALVASAGKLGGLKAGYSIGASTIQDMRPLTYEDGQPIRRNGWKYLLASTHPVDDILGAIGVKLFRFNNIKFEYIGMLFNRYGTRIFAGNSDKLMYDRNLKKWIYISGNWSDTPVTSYIGSTEEDMLKGGIFVINTAPILLPENDVVIGSYDMDIVYVNNKYRIVYAISAPALYTAIGECATFDGQYTRVIKLNNNVALREGNVFTKIGGIYYVTSSAGAGSGTSELGCYSSVDLSLVCNINTSRFPTSLGSFPSWGCIIPIVNKSTTNYMLLLFSPKKAYLTWNGTVWIPMNYGYGDLWVYESQETQPAQEFANKDLLFFD